jgi:hypothetical protein
MSAQNGCRLCRTIISTLKAPFRPDSKLFYFLDGDTFSDEKNKDMPYFLYIRCTEAVPKSRDDQEIWFVVENEEGKSFIRHPIPKLKFLRFATVLATHYWQQSVEYKF